MGFIAFMALMILLFTFVISLFAGEPINIFTTFATYVDAIVYYLGRAMDIVWLFIPKAIAISCMTLAIAMNVFRYGYKLIMWAVKKVPFTGIR